MLANNIVVMSFSQKQREKQNAVHIPLIIAINYQVCHYRRRTNMNSPSAIQALVITGHNTILNNSRNIGDKE